MVKKNSNVMTEEILKDIKTSLGLDDVDEAIPYINQCIQARDRILSDEYSAPHELQIKSPDRGAAEISADSPS